MSWMFNRNNALMAGAGAVMLVWLGAWLFMVSAKRGPTAEPAEPAAKSDAGKDGSSAESGTPVAVAPAVPKAPVGPEAPTAVVDFPDVPETAKLVEKAEPAFPFTGRVKADDVYTRSGPNLNYYPTGKVHAGEAVVVIAEKNGWFEIKPPPGQFSWIDKAYIQLDLKDPAKGTVTGSNVRVRAGSLIVASAKDSVQMKVNKGLAVDVLGEDDGFCKVRPPEGATVWVSAEFVARPGPSARPVDIAAGPESKADAKAEVVGPPEPAAPTLEIVYKAMTAELKKAAGDQNLEEIIDQFSRARSAAQDETAKRWCDYYIGDLQRRKKAREARADAEKVARSFADEVKKARQEVIAQSKFEPVARPAAAEVERAKMDEFTGYIMTTRYWEAYRGSWEGSMRFRLTRGLPPEDNYVVWVQGEPGVDLGKYLNRKVTLRGKLMLLEEHRSRLLMVKEVADGTTTAAAKTETKAAAKPAPKPAEKGAEPAAGKLPEPVPEAP